MLFRFVLLFFLVVDSNRSEPCSDIVRPYQNYLAADPSLTIGRFPSESYQSCGQQCRSTTLCRTAVWCQEQCFLYQEYFAFGTVISDSNCFLITLSGLAFNEIEPRVRFFQGKRYEESQRKYYEHTYQVKSIEECVQLCRLDSHCLTASYFNTEYHCSLFAEHAAQGRTLKDQDWTIIILDTCAGRDPNIYPCLIDKTQADKKLCDLLVNARPSSIVSPDTETQRVCLTGWLTKLLIYWPQINQDKESVWRSTYDFKQVEPFLSLNEENLVNDRVLHIDIDQRIQRPVVSLLSDSSVDHGIFEVFFSSFKMNEEQARSNFRMNQNCRWCYFARDGHDVTYVSMDQANFIARYQNGNQNLVPIFLPRPAGLLVHNHRLWIVNGSHLIILESRKYFDESVHYFVINQMDLSSITDLLPSDPMDEESPRTFRSLHLDVDHYGRVYISGFLQGSTSSDEIPITEEHQQTFLLADGFQREPNVLCNGPWAMFGVRVYHSKLKLRMLTTTSERTMELFSMP